MSRAISFLAGAALALAPATAAAEPRVESPAKVRELKLPIAHASAAQLRDGRLWVVTDTAQPDAERYDVLSIDLASGAVEEKAKGLGPVPAGTLGGWFVIADGDAVWVTGGTAGRTCPGLTVRAWRASPSGVRCFSLDASGAAIRAVDGCPCPADGAPDADVVALGVRDGALCFAGAVRAAGEGVLPVPVLACLDPSGKVTAEHRPKPPAPGRKAVAAGATLGRGSTGFESRCAPGRYAERRGEDERDLFWAACLGGKAGVTAARAGVPTADWSDGDPLVTHLADGGMLAVLPVRCPVKADYEEERRPEHCARDVEVVRFGPDGRKAAARVLDPLDFGGWGLMADSMFPRVLSTADGRTAWMAGTTLDDGARIRLAAISAATLKPERLVEHALPEGATVDEMIQADAGRFVAVGSKRGADGKRTVFALVIEVR
ncbi:MAG: hypothetical protein FJ087_13205 [Deltaproteobacteria bacterium]|nr:hypothetical protein [Deltaproteobacteria bacterium]